MGGRWAHEGGHASDLREQLDKHRSACRLRVSDKTDAYREHG